MTGSTFETKKRCDAFSAKWQAFLASPGTDLLLEFAVSISSFTEFLHSKGLSGLHQISRSLEQQVLALFDASGTEVIAPATLSALTARVQELGAKVADYIDSKNRPIVERRSQRDSETSFETQTTHRVWLLGNAGATWKELALQLGYFGIQAQIHRAEELPQHDEEPVLVLLDAKGLTVQQVSEQVQTLRARFSASKLLVQRLPADFDSLKSVLAAGCDFCLTAGTAPSLVLAKIIELCGNQDEEPYRALVVEDSLTASNAIQRTLGMCGIETHAISKPHEVLECLTRLQPDLILMDMFMPGCTGVEAARVIRQHPEFLSIPIVYLSGDTNIPMQVEALRLGGDHFLTKPFNPVILNAVVQSKIERYRALRRTMLRDGLTGLFNHKTATEKLASALRFAQADQQPLSVAMIDIDHFKKVNDNYGHQVGDQVIRSMAWFLTQRLRKSDIVGRYGGEEFLLILPHADADLAMEVLDRIRSDFGQIEHPFNETWFSATFSGGVAQLRPGTSAAELIKQADEALYQAKLAGRNRIVKSA